MQLIIYKVNMSAKLNDFSCPQSKVIIQFTFLTLMKPYMYSCHKCYKCTVSKKAKQSYYVFVAFPVWSRLASIQTGKLLMYGLASEKHLILAYLLCWKENKVFFISFKPLWLAVSCCFCLWLMYFLKVGVMSLYIRQFSLRPTTISPNLKEFITLLLSQHGPKYSKCN